MVVKEPRRAVGVGSQEEVGVVVRQIMGQCEGWGCIGEGGEVEEGRDGGKGCGGEVDVGEEHMECVVVAWVGEVGEVHG